MAGGKGGSQTSSVKLPGFIEDAVERAIARGEAAGRIGFVPSTGPDVAAFTPMQEASFAGTNQAASAFGLPTATGTGLPQPLTFAGGVQGLSSRGLFDQMVSDLETQRPGQFGAIQDFFIDPVTGAFPLGTPVNQPAPVVAPVVSSSDEPSVFDSPTVARDSGVGFTSIRDMFDGGGPGASGDTFQGGGILSDIANSRAERKGLL